LHLAVRRNEDVRRLEIAMDDEIGMGVSDGSENIEEQPNALLDAETALVAVFIDALALHVLQNEIGLATGLDARIHEARDVRVLQAREQAALAPKPLLGRGPDVGGVQELHRPLSLEPPVATMREPHGAHAAVTERPVQRVRAQGVALETRGPLEGSRRL